MKCTTDGSDAELLAALRANESNEPDGWNDFGGEIRAAAWEVGNEEAKRRGLR